MDGFPVKVTEAVCLGASLTLSGLFYYLYKKTRTTVHKLDDAPHFTIDGKLKDILKVTPGACLQYAVIEGAVQPAGEPLMSHFQKEVVGVLQKFMLKEHRLVWNSLSRSWTDSERVMHQRVNAVPFVLVGSDETTVKVLCPLQASGEHMEITHEKFHQVNYGLGDIVGQYLSGEKLKGQLETEEMLKVGTALTGVGELILDTDGTLCLRPPSNGSQYFLSSADFDTLRGEQESTAVCWKVLAIASAVVGAAVLLWVGRRYYYRLKVRWEQEQERREFERLQDETPRTRTSVMGSEASEDGVEENVENACVICLYRPRNCILLDCGHVCCCHSCYQALPHRRCPICRQQISRVVPLYHV
ncbi:mitochondrial ubiquitin ligase activator of nfkb 1-A [Morone saxatilis]|uniref:mitochondrial ubiquitin ligase activator of nfkb 1-A n=1 Tax=Morone saxatilis TaxID=34816 RepID=UPI0015E25436|nr:mitochondrial ubiquitin ligase activator of nfkb 1-A [Morone saxatilis]XP_035526475.1 mitochondrial ubiquitin ligase activator of nfkb 1-A [Morone saxatilis]XP_035526476.1 mitochondrial ubiquitin ligase activator of nfkb 1-A [Morone saxatilis]